jgi:uncharacterized membrane protein
VGVFVGLVLALAVAYALTRGGGSRGCSGACALVVAVAATAATAFFVYVGNKNHWTSDGPGMLFIMLGVLVCGGVALSGWAAVLGALLLPARDPDPSDRVDPRDRLKF